MSEKPIRHAVALVFREGESLWAFRRSETKEVYKGLWSLPSTYLEEGESATEAANRLAYRKLGLQSVTIAALPLGNSGLQEKPHWYLDMSVYEVVSYEGVLSISPEEYLEMRLVSPQELYDLVQAQQVEDAGECTKTFLKTEGFYKE